MNSQNLHLHIENQSSVLRAHALKFTGNIEDANDLVQDTFLRAMRYYNQYKEGTNINGWLYTIMRNTFFNQCNSRSKKSMSYLDQEQLIEIPSSYNDHNHAVKKFVADDIRTALNKIPVSYSKPFVLFFEGYTYQEIAAKFDIPIGTVKTRIHAARKLLKNDLSIQQSRF